MTFTELLVGVNAEVIVSVQTPKNPSKWLGRQMYCYGDNLD